MLRYIFLLVVFLPVAAWASEDGRQIVVSATGSAAAASDMATVTVGVSREAPSAAEAMSLMSDAAQSVLDEVTAAGIDARDVQTSSISLYPVWEQGNAQPRQIRGYAAATMVNIRVLDLDRLGGLLDSVVGGGANEMNGLSFGIQDVEPIEDLARADAVRQATRKAETLAAAAGVTLGPVQTISEGGGGAPAPMMRGAVMEAAAVPIASGELDIRVTVTATFAIAE